MQNILISIVLPVYNQADHVATVVEQYEAALSKVHNSHEIILVPNNCMDNSREICESLAEKFEPVRSIYSECGGWGLAVKLGLSQARGNLLCYTNLARTSAQNLILTVLFAVAFPNVVIKANRKIRENWFRRLGSLLYNLECRMLFDLSFWDINGTPKIFPRTFNKLLSLKSNDDLLDLEFSALCRGEQYPMLEVPIFSTRRHGGNSTTTLRSAMRMYLGAYRMRQVQKKSDR